jgi:soluble lytic murein transglycosylase-like protein
VADHFNNVVKPKTAAATTAFGRAGEFYDDLTGNMKSLLLSWSPFHRVTESMRMMESLGIVKGGALALQTNLGMAEPIDYFNLSPTEESAIRDGIVTSDPRGRSMSNVEEGVSAGEGTWGAKSYKLLDKGLEKLGVPAEIRNKINLQKILTDDVFGPNGMITHAKFALYEARKPQIAARIAADHPDWSPQEVDKQAGRLTASFANDKFGGLNLVLLGRTLNDQKILRRVLLAPDFLESTGRSVLDLARPYGNDMAANLIRFNIAHLLTVAGINYALHHEEGDDTIKGAVDASHLLDHPFGVVSADGKTVYGVRTTVADFIHAVSKPFDFGKERLNPAVKSIDEILEQRNQYGRKESFGEALKSIPKATLPIQIQGPLGLGAGSVTEPSSVDQLLKSLGVQAKPNRTPAEDAAIAKVSAKLQGTEAQTGPALVKQRLKFNAEDKLRDAIQALQTAKKNPNGADFIKLQADYNNATRDVDTLARKRILTPEERKNLLDDAKTTRLASIFKRLNPSDALEIWDKANDQEKKQLGSLMHKKLMDWSSDEAKKGVTSTTLSPEDQQILNRFRAASTQLAEIMSRPTPRPKPATQTNSLDFSAGFRSIVADRAETPLPAPIPVAHEETPLPAPVPVATRTEPLSAEELDPIVKKASDKYGVDADLIREIIRQESDSSPVALSPRGAKGIMQLMDSTAVQYGVKNPFDPEENIDGAVHFIADLMRRYDGDIEKVLAAYDAGPARVDEYGGVPPIPETQAYVRDITRRLKAKG